MKRKGFWTTVSLVNLCIVALLGVTLRTKLLFPLRVIDFDNFLSAHSHFAFGGWVTLALMLLFVDNLLPEARKQRNIYQWVLCGIELTALGMVVSFPFHGYAFFSIVFSTLFIFFTYVFCWVFIADLSSTAAPATVKLLATCGLVSLAVSSAGPFTLAYILATKTGSPILYRDAIYFFLHFQYNGFFTLSVFALLFDHVIKKGAYPAARNFYRFATALTLSVIPTFFLTLLWHAEYLIVRVLAAGGCLLVIISLAVFARFAFDPKLYQTFREKISRRLAAFAMLSFGIKMILQTGTIIPWLGNAVFGYRPIIIGFLHLVFLGLVSFSILSNYWESGIFPAGRKFPPFATLFFASAVIVNETILLFDGIGLMLNTTHPAYPWLLWIAAILLLTGAILMLSARLSNRRGERLVRVTAPIS